jgi:hypothetical protein
VNENAQIKRKVEVINMVPNLLWSLIFLLPVCIFCYSAVNRQILYVFILISLITIFFPNTFFNRLQLSKSDRFYKKAGVMRINTLTQNGTLVNNFVRKKYPGYNPLPANKTAAGQLLNRGYMFEKYHFLMFCFFGLLTIYAIVGHYYFWAVVFLLSNILYNVYPILLQQYIRLRLTKK